MDVYRGLALGTITPEEAADRLSGARSAARDYVTLTPKGEPSSLTLTPTTLEDLRSCLRWICVLADRYPHLYRLTHGGCATWSKVEPLLTAADRLDEEAILPIVRRRIDDVLSLSYSLPLRLAPDGGPDKRLRRRAGTYPTDAPDPETVDVDGAVAAWRFGRDPDARLRARDAAVEALFPDRRGGKVLPPRDVVETHNEATGLVEGIAREVLDGGEGLGVHRPSDPNLASAIDLKYLPVLPRWSPANLSPGFRKRIDAATAGPVIVRAMTPPERRANAVAVDLIALALHHQGVDDRSVRRWLRQ